MKIQLGALKLHISRTLKALTLRMVSENSLLSYNIHIYQKDLSLCLGLQPFIGIMRFVSKKTYKLYTLDLDRGMYTTMWTNNTLVGDGKFENSPDQIVRNNGGDFLYFTEDGGSTPGVYAMDTNGSMYAIFEAYSDMYKGDETTGLAFSPDGNTMYANFQDCGCKETYGEDCGCLLRFIRDDGLGFDGESQ